MGPEPQFIITANVFYLEGINWPARKEPRGNSPIPQFPNWELTVTHLLSRGKLMLRILRFTFATAETCVAFQFGTQDLGTWTKKGKVRRGNQLSRRSPLVPALLANLGSSMLMISPHRPSEREPDKEKGPRNGHAALKHTT